MTHSMTAELERLEAIAKQLALPDKGIRYTNGRLSGSFETELFAGGENAKSLYWLTQNAPTILALIATQRALVEALEKAERMLDDAHTSLRAVSGYLTQPIMALDARTRVQEISEALANIQAGLRLAKGAPHV